MHHIYLAIIPLLLLVGCANSTKTTVANSDALSSSIERAAAAYRADSAYQHIKQQVGFGPRIPGSEGHSRCVDYIASKLKAYGADTIIIQETTVKNYLGESIPARNIIGRFGLAKDKRILLGAHYDTRPWADNEINPADAKKPVPGANDGGSGVGVMLEIARAIQQDEPRIGVDMAFFDVEDMGHSGAWATEDDTWCLGSQYFAKTFDFAPTQRPQYGIVLDMVGGKDAVFHREYMSNKLAPNIVNKIWSKAAKTKYADRFINQLGGSIIDDHMPINNIGIPCVDIIESVNNQTRTFPSTWHKLTDNLAEIDPTSLDAVGQVVLAVIYSE